MTLFYIISAFIFTSVLTGGPLSTARSVRGWRWLQREVQQTSWQGGDKRTQVF